MPAPQRYPNVSQIMEFLFRRYAEQNAGERPSFRHVSLAVAASPEYVRKLYDRSISNPGREAMLDLATFFDINPLVWFPEVWEHYAPDLLREYQQIMDE
ncbi:MAG: hypothetical protein JOZ51_27125 [Chloroflexi bacterium]|nr:hypothetical protein [Chloroflexota bacterium]